MPLRRLKQALVLAVGLALAGCSSLPRSGPSTDEVVDRFEKGDNPLGVKLVDLTPGVVSAIDSAPRQSLAAVSRIAANRPVDRLGPGDLIQISIYEAGPGLFSNLQRTTTNGDAGSTAETLPQMRVDRAGRVEIPFAGMVSVAGRTTTEVQQIIERRLAEKASQPQVIVTWISGDANSVIVSGDVKNPGRRPLGLTRENLLDVVALSGGPTHASADTMVSVTRGGVTASAPLSTIETVPSENILMEPQDRVQVDFAPRTFLVFGATGRVAQTAFEDRRVSLAEAMARSGGLDDSRADPASVFLFRMEPAPMARAIGLGDAVAPVPVIYRANLSDPQNFFLMERLAMRDKDLLYVANAKTVQLYKFLQLIYTVVTPAVTAKTITQ